MKKLIITAALTGSMTLPTQTPHLPITPEQIAEEAYKSWEAGAAAVHVHARNPKDGSPTKELEVFREIVTQIKKKCDAIVCITTGGRLMTAEERIAVVPTFKPELASLDMGTMNFNLAPLLARIKEFKYDWERNLLQNTSSIPFKNTFEALEVFCKSMKENNTKPECEVFDVGQIYNLSFMVRQNPSNCQDPLWIQFVTGVLGGIGRSVEDVVVLKSTCDRLFGRDKYEWSVIGAGYPWQFQAASIAMTMGGHVRVGMEDNIFVKRKQLAKSNAELVAKTVRLADELGREIASSDEARKMLNLKGSENVNF
jgi:uncharacterized protein (DUF849 family)